ncbi:dentin sialophosphoprotein-like isoform X1 [Penaeus japonicus]|uniref:dentin sialophosphoprotein-like isoform X1 n=1 Tax=Penaeus japonicus TaxID=27405 RepID=UPI001C717800|nr:dentin sialophosphoprotein-like isoform X1 [Penaeus japonicus]
MREHLPGVGQPLGTPPHHRRSQDPAAGDIARSDSYSLARGGKLVSSRPWASSGAQILVNMHALEASAKDTGGKEPRRPPSSGTSSSDSESDSDSSDSDDTSEDEYEVRMTRRQPDLSHYTLAEEDEDLEQERCVNNGECKMKVASAKCSELRQSEREKRLPGDGHSRPHLAQDAREGAADGDGDGGGGGGGDGNDSDAKDDGSDDEEDDDDDDDNDDDESESDETESTVRARLGAGAENGGNEPGGGGGEGAAPPPEEDPNDTLSTLSGDLSFDDRDVISPPRENGAAAAQELEALPKDASAASDSIISDSSHTAADAESRESPEECVASESRVPPEGERSTPQRESVPTGVFCLSGYPKQACPGLPQDPSSHSSPSGLTCPQPEHESGSAVDVAGEMNQVCKRSTSTAQHSGGAARGMGAVQGRAEDAKSQERSQRSLPFPPKYVSGHSRVAQLRGTWDSSTPSSAAPRHEGHGVDREPPKQQAHSASEDVRLNSQPGHHAAPQQSAARTERQGAAKSKSNSSVGDVVHAQHARQSLQQAKLQKQSNAQHNAQVYQLQQRQQQVQHQKRRVQQQQQQQQESRRHHGGKNGAVNPANTTAATTNSRDGVCGGSGTRSPAHAYQPAAAATPTSSMPRLHAASSGLGGSASRLSAGAGGGAAGSYPGLAGSRLGGSYTGLVSSASSGYGSTAGGVLPAVPTRHEDSEDLSDVSSGATSEDSARRRRRRSAQSVKGEASVSGNEDFEWVRASPMLTGLLEGHVTRLATPPDHRGLRTSLATPPESGEEGGGGPTHRHRQYPRPPPAPRPRTLEPTDLVPHRPIRDGLRDSRDRLYSPSRDLTSHRRSRDSSVERSGRDSSCERGSVSSLHQHGHHHHHHHPGPRLPQHACDCPSCWCDEEEPGYDSCDERHHHHRHSYHEGLHHAHLHSLQAHHHQPCGRDAPRERRTRGQGSGDSGRSSPCCCRHCHQLGSLSSLSSHDYCANNRLALPCSTKVGGALATLQGTRRHRRLDSDYIALWSCHSPPVRAAHTRLPTPGRPHTATHTSDHGSV